MIEAYLHQLRTFPANPTDSADELAAARARLPRATARRMSNLGVMLADVLPEDDSLFSKTLIYATTYAEAGSLEKYLDSFPYASPLHFQTSIHPSAVQQALIARRAPVETFFPLAGESGVAAAALRLALTHLAGPVCLCGGEEAGGWLTDLGLASSTSWAFAFVLSASEDGCRARLRWEPADADPASDLPALTLPAFHASLAQATDGTWSEEAGGRLILRWS